MKRIIFRDGNVLNIIRLGKTSNKKICADPKEKMVQTYHFDRKQYEHVAKPAVVFKDFFGDADANCLNCPLKVYGKCYTHKFTQARGFTSMLKSIYKEIGEWENIPTRGEVDLDYVAGMCEDRFVRFGSYGEPVLLGHEFVTLMAGSSKSHTGYTHQWKSSDKQWASAFFMASTHSGQSSRVAAQSGWRSFETTGPDNEVVGSVQCPASAEAGFKSSCDKCGLCSGSQGKGKKSIYIQTH